MATDNMDKKAMPNRTIKVLDIILNVLAGIFFVLCIFVIILAIGSKNNDGAINLFGHEMRIILSSSMEKSEYTDVSGYEIKDIPAGALVSIETVPDDKAEAADWYAELKVGDVLTFSYVYETQEIITHRIIEITEKDDGYVIVLRGDNQNSENGALTQTIDTTSNSSFNYIIGKVVGVNLALGAFVTAVKSPLGFVLIIVLPCAIIMIAEIIRIVNMVTEKKRYTRAEADKKKDMEIERLRKLLEEAKMQSSITADGTDGKNKSPDGTDAESKSPDGTDTESKSTDGTDGKNKSPDGTEHSADLSGKQYD